MTLTSGSDAVSTSSGSRSNITRSASIGDASGAEGSSGPSTMGFTVSLSEASNDAVTVDYSTANGAAAAGSGDSSNWRSPTGSMTRIICSPSPARPATTRSRTSTSPGWHPTSTGSRSWPTTSTVLAGQTRQGIWRACMPTRIPRVPSTTPTTPSASTWSRSTRPRSCSAPHCMGTAGKGYLMAETVDSTPSAPAQESPHTETNTATFPTGRISYWQIVEL